MNEFLKKHLDDEQLTDAYYGAFDAAGHLTVCDECRANFERMREVLDAFSEYPIPYREPGHGSAVWTSLLPKLPHDRSHGLWRRWWILTPAFAALLTVAFVIGRLTGPSHSTGIPEKARERILLMSLSDHLEQSQIVLANVANAGTEMTDLGSERDRAHELLGANRLLRQTAARLGDAADAALLDDLERVLLEIANSPDRLPWADLDRKQQQIKQEGLLFKVRVSSIASRERGEKL